MSEKVFKNPSFKGSRYEFVFRELVCENCGHTFENHKGLNCTGTPMMGYPVVKGDDITIKLKDIISSQREWEWFCLEHKYGISRDCKQCVKSNILIEGTIYEATHKTNFDLGDLFVCEEALYEVHKNTVEKDGHIQVRVISQNSDFSTTYTSGDLCYFDIEDLFEEDGAFMVVPLDSNGVQQKSQFKSTTEKKEETMSTSIILNTNITAAKAAALNEAGRIANSQLTKMVAKSAPLMVKGYIETPFGKILVANLFRMAVQQFKPGSEKGMLLADAMITQAYQEVLQSFDLEGMLEEFLADSKISKALSKVAEEKPKKLADTQE